MSQSNSLEGRSDSGLTKVFTALAVAIALWNLLGTLHIIRLGWITVPVGDDWDRWITFFRQRYSWDWFYAEHVDHRLVLARMFFAVDQTFFQGRGWDLILCSLAIQAASGWMLWRLAGMAYAQCRMERILQAAFIATCLYSAQQWMNFIFPFQVQFPMVYCCSLAALYAIWKSAVRNWSVPWLVASIVLAIAATYSMANGVLIWPVMLMAAVWLRMPRGWIAATAATWILVAVAYFYHWVSSTSSQLGLLERLPKAMLFWLELMGSPAVFAAGSLNPSETFRSACTAVIGGVLVLSLLGGFVSLWRWREKFNKASAMLIFFGVFLAGGFATMGYGRSLGSVMEAFTSRYQTPSYLFWVTLLLAGWPLLHRIPRALLAAAMCVAMLLGIVAHEHTAYNDVRDRMYFERLGALVVVDNVADVEPWFWLFHDPGMAMDTIDFLRQNNLTVFSEPWSHWPGTSINGRFSIDNTPNACQGKVDPLVPVESTLRPGWRASGWAWDQKDGIPPRYLLLVGADGKVAGVAMSGFPAAPSVPPAYSEGSWRGYVTGSGSGITAYVLEADGRSLCPLTNETPQSSSGPTSAEVTFQNLGTFLPVTLPQITGGFVVNGYFKGNNGPGAPPVDGPVYGSFPDSAKGSLRLGPFHLDGHTQIAIPVVSGPDSHNLSILVRDAATKQTLAELTPPPVRVQWWAWHPDLPTGKELNVEILVEDKGSGWGQWLAIGWPHILR